MAPLIMRYIVNTVVAQDENINEATSSYIDDVFINENIYPAFCVKEHFQRFGLMCNAPEQLPSGTHMLQLYVWEEREKSFSEVVEVSCRCCLMY